MGLNCEDVIDPTATSGARAAHTIRRGQRLQGLSFQCQAQFPILNEQAFRIPTLEKGTNLAFSRFR